MTEDVKDNQNGTEKNADKQQSTKKESTEVLAYKLDAKKAQQSAIQKKDDLVSMQKTSALDPVAYAQLKVVAEDYLTSGALPSSLKNSNQVLRILQASTTLGVTYEDALSGMYYVNGQLNIYGMLTATVLANKGYKWEFHDENDDFSRITCKIWKGGSVFDPETEKMQPDPATVTEFHKDTFTLDSAKKSGYGGGVGFKDGKNRQRKMRYEVLSLIIHTKLPSVLSGVAGIGEVSERYGEEIEQDKSEQRQYKKKKIEEALDTDAVEGEILDASFTPKPVSNGMDA